MRLSRFGVDKQGNRHTPGALAGDTPVWATVDHACNTVFAPFRYPTYLLNFAQRLSAQTLFVHADEPLRRRPENDRRFMSPAMWVTVLVGFVMDKIASFAQGVNNRGIRFEHMLTGEQFGIFFIDTVVIHRVIHL